MIISLYIYIYIVKRITKFIVFYYFIKYIFVWTISVKCEYNIFCEQYTGSNERNIKYVFKIKGKGLKHSGS